MASLRYGSSSPSATMAMPNSDAQPPVIRRSFTLPPTLSDAARSRGSGRNSPDPSVETLFVHHAGKIVAFSPSLGYARSRSASLAASTPEDEPVGTLPWASKTERTIAAGQIRVYRVLGSVAFLDSGKTLHPILAKSQCWCVDGETKFVLRIRNNSYYRIELPNTCAEDRQVAKAFEVVLDTVLQYEKTPCPFQRGFVVELPESPVTQKRPWTPKTRRETLSELIPNRSSGKEEVSEAEAEGICGGYDGTQSDISDDATVTPPDTSTISFVDMGSLKTPTKDGEMDRLPAGHFDNMETPTQPKTMTGIRAVTAPLPLRPKSSPPSSGPALEPVAQNAESRPKAKEADAVSIASIDSFHSFKSFPNSSSPPSPPYSDPPSPPQRQDRNLAIDVARSRPRKHDVSELTETPKAFVLSHDLETPTWPDVNEPCSPLRPMTPALTNDDATSQSEDHWQEPGSPVTTVRRRLRQRRSHSPLPSPANLYTPHARLSGHHLTTAILQKTCSLLLGPPAQLVALMLNIAARIANGAFRGSAVAYLDGDRPIPCSWDYSEDEGMSKEEWEEDDYGISIGAAPAATAPSPQLPGGSWEID